MTTKALYIIHDGSSLEYSVVAVVLIDRCLPSVLLIIATVSDALLVGVLIH